MTVEDGTGYAKLYALDPNTKSQDLVIDIPEVEGAKIITARLYNYVSWSTSDGYVEINPGVPAEAKLTLTT